MKSYLQGLITGGVFVFAIFVLMGATDTTSDLGRYQIATTSYAGNANIMETTIDSKTGEVIKREKVSIAKFYNKLKK
tara:strand:- start:108 stop:338 length:231 start_codon:yes stop_codon:yes gene_type:complete